jgi:drug/metabolite transporter (DMT)-like permease
MLYISIILVIVGTIFYELLEKTVPKKENPYLYLLFTYLTALTCLIIGLVASNYNFNNLIKDINVQSALVGISAMFVDYGLILSYKKGWKISTLNVTYTVFVLIILLVVGVLFLEEKVSSIELIGIVLCIISIILMNHKTARRPGRR